MKDVSIDLREQSFVFVPSVTYHKFAGKTQVYAPVNPLFLITNFLRSIITPWCELLFTWCMQNQIKEPINMNFYFNNQTKNNNES